MQFVELTMFVVLYRNFQQDRKDKIHESKMKISIYLPFKIGKFAHTQEGQDWSLILQYFFIH